MASITLSLELPLGRIPAAEKVSFRQKMSWDWIGQKIEATKIRLNNKILRLECWKNLITCPIIVAGNLLSTLLRVKKTFLIRYAAFENDGSSSSSIGCQQYSWMNFSRSNKDVVFENKTKIKVYILIWNTSIIYE